MLYSPAIGKQEIPPKNFQLPWSPILKEEEIVRANDSYVYKKNFQILRNNILDRNLDSIHLNFGEEGTGKTSSSIQDILEIDTKFDKQSLSDLPQVPFSVKQFKEFLLQKRVDPFYEGRRGVGILFDEGNLVANARKALSKESIEFTSLMTQIRSEFGFFVVFNFQSYRFAESYLKNDRCRSANRCFFKFDRRKLCHVSGQAHYYNRPLIRQIKKNTQTGQIEFPAKALFTRQFQPAFPHTLWKAVNEKKYRHLLEVEENSKKMSFDERKRARLETEIQIEKLSVSPNPERLLVLTNELKKILEKRLL